LGIITSELSGAAVLLLGVSSGPLLTEVPVDRPKIPLSGLLLKVGAEVLVLPRLYCHLGFLILGFITSELSGPVVFLLGISSASLPIEVLVARPQISFSGLLRKVGVEVLVLPCLYCHRGLLNLLQSRFGMGLLVKKFKELVKVVALVICLVTPAGDSCELAAEFGIKTEVSVVL
jgi:hypothetical protein